MREKSVNSYMIYDLFAKLLLSFVLLLFLFFGLEYAKKKNDVTDFWRRLYALCATGS